jgi:hypothetical protein
VLRYCAFCKLPIKARKERNRRYEMSVLGLIGHCNKRVKTHFQADSENEVYESLPLKTSSSFKLPLRHFKLKAEGGFLRLYK